VKITLDVASGDPYRNPQLVDRDILPVASDSQVSRIFFFAVIAKQRHFTKRIMFSALFAKRICY
jgi:hypothetical protein